MSRPLYPILLDLSRTPILVVGGGAVALRKVGALVEHGGRPTVVAPEVDEDLLALLREEELEFQRRPYSPGEAARYRMVIAATSRPEVNARVAGEAREAGAWVNVADDPAASTFHVPAAIRQGEVTVALATGGASPLLARRLRERLERVVTPGVGRAAERLRRARERVRQRWPEDEARRRAFWAELITAEFLDCAIAGQDEEIESRIEQCLSQS